MMSDESIEAWMANPTVPAWIQEIIGEKPGEPDTLHYDEKRNKVVLTIIETGETFDYDSVEESYEAEVFDEYNIEFITDFPDIKNSRIPTIIKSRRALFIGTKKQNYQNLMYKLFMSKDIQDEFDKEQSFNIAQTYLSSHIVFWNTENRPRREYSFGSIASVKKRPIINEANHTWVWEATTTTFKDKTTFSAQGATIEEAIIKLAQTLNNHYTWEGTLKK